MSNFRAPFEWEQLDQPVVLFGETLEKLGQSLNTLPKKIEIKRNSDYELEVVATGNAEHSIRDLTNHNTVNGQTIKGDTLVFNSMPFEKYTLNNFIPMSTNRRGDGEYTIQAHIGSVLIEKGDQSNHTFIIHALNCPDFDFPDSTAWEDSGESTITIGGSRSQAHEGFTYPYPNRGSKFSYNCVHLQNKFGTVVFTKLEDESLKNHRPCSIHFIDKKLSEDEDLRRKWLIALSYFVGSRLIPVAESPLSSYGAATSQKCFSPYLMNDFKKPSMPPCKAVEQNGYHHDSVALSKQIELFIENYELYNLDTVVWNLWFGRAMPQGLNLAGYSASLEALSKAWFESENNKSKKTYVDPKTFQELISPTLTMVRDLIKTDSAWQKIEYKLKDANLLSAHQKIAALFSGLGLETGTVEKDVLGSRHKTAHGKSISETDYSFVIKAARAYEVIINRCILAAIKASDTYIDYSTHGFPEKTLRTSLGGSDILNTEKGK